MNMQRYQIMINRSAYTVLPLAVVAAFMFWTWSKDVAFDKNHKIEVLMPITLLKEPPQCYPKTNIEVGKIRPGEVVDVLRMGYGKDFRAWHVRGPKGQEGWFVEDGENIRVSIINP
jgi:hypothetical protein